MNYLYSIAITLLPIFISIRISKKIVIIQKSKLIKSSIYVFIVSAFSEVLRYLSSYIMSHQEEIPSAETMINTNSTMVTIREVLFIIGLSLLLTGVSKMARDGNKKQN